MKNLILPLILLSFSAPLTSGINLGPAICRNTLEKNICKIFSNIAGVYASNFKLLLERLPNEVSSFMHKVAYSKSIQDFCPDNCFLPFIISLIYRLSSTSRNMREFVCDLSKSEVISKDKKNMIFAVLFSSFLVDPHKMRLREHNAKEITRRMRYYLVTEEVFACCQNILKAMVRYSECINVSCEGLDHSIKCLEYELSKTNVIIDQSNQIRLKQLEYLKGGLKQGRLKRKRAESQSPVPEDYENGGGGFFVFSPPESFGLGEVESPEIPKDDEFSWGW